MDEDRIRFVEYKGKQILLEDFTNVRTDDELLQLVWAAQKIVQSQPPKSALVVVDMTNTHFGPKSTQASKTVSKGNTPHIKASAMVGLNKLAEIVLNSIRMVSGRNIASFGTREEAYEWLSKQS